MASVTLPMKKTMSSALQDAIARGDVVHAVSDDGRSVFVIKTGAANRSELRSEIEKFKRSGSPARLAALIAAAAAAAALLLIRFLSN